MCTYTCTPVHLCTHAYSSTLMYAHIHSCSFHVHLCMHAQVHPCTLMYTCVQSCALTLHTCTLMLNLVTYSHSLWTLMLTLVDLFSALYTHVHTDIHP